MKKTKIQKAQIIRAVKMFTLSIGFTAICMLLTAGYPSHEQDTGLSKSAREASIFNGGSMSLFDNGESYNAEKSNKTNYVIPLGTSFGIKLFTDGVIVASLSNIYTGDSISCPAKDAGIKPGDYVITANGEEIENNAKLATLINASQGQQMALSVRRNGETIETTLTPILDNGTLKVGMWIRDSAAGIGTLTFYNPETSYFAGLGHGICDIDTNDIMSLKEGEPAEIALCGITKGKKDEPGQLQGYFSSDETMGSLEANNDTGVYGTLVNEPAGELMEVMRKEDLHTGEIKILTSIDDTGPHLYDAKIEKINALNRETKNFIIKVTDFTLLEKTGGIVQGMSGSPIFQDGKFAGAVTHVFTEDPETGYGIFAETMVEQSVIFSMSK